MIDNNVSNIDTRINYKVQPITDTGNDRNKETNQVSKISNEENKVKVDYLNATSKGQNIDIKV